MITLTSGNPAQAREMAAWADRHGARFLDGAVKNVPSAVGKPDTLVCYSGDRAVYDEHEATLRALGGDTVHLGTEPDLAALYESAVGATLLPTLVGFFQGAALITERGLKASTLVPFSVKWLEMVCSILPDLARQIDTGDYSDEASPIGMFQEGLDEERRSAQTSSIDLSWQDPLHDLINRAVTEGRADQSISALIELLRNPPHQKAA